MDAGRGSLRMGRRFCFTWLVTFEHKHFGWKKRRRGRVEALLPGPVITFGLRSALMSVITCQTTRGLVRQHHQGGGRWSARIRREHKKLTIKNQSWQKNFSQLLNSDLFRILFCESFYIKPLVCFPGGSLFAMEN
jgi:hypothetical protein